MKKALTFEEAVDSFKKNIEEGIKWLKKAALNNEPYAQLVLGGQYHQGKNLKKDKALSLKFLHLAADNGLSQAKDILNKTPFQQ